MMAKEKNHAKDEFKLNPFCGSSSSIKESKSFKGKPKKKRKFYAEVKDELVVFLSVKKSMGKKKRERKQRKLKAYDLSALSKFLPDLNTIQSPISSKNLKPNSKDRQKLVQIEGAHLNRVLDDPVFQMDPLAAINEHLRRTQLRSETVKEQISGKKQNEKEKKPPSSGCQLMDI